MSEIKITLKIPQPSIESSNKTERPIDILIEKIYDYITVCESPIIDSSREYEYLKVLYKKLSEKPQLNPVLKPAFKALKALIEKNTRFE